MEVGRHGFEVRVFVEFRLGAVEDALARGFEVDLGGADSRVLLDEVILVCGL